MGCSTSNTWVILGQPKPTPTPPTGRISPRSARRTYLFSPGRRAAHFLYVSGSARFPGAPPLPSHCLPGPALSLCLATTRSRKASIFAVTPLPAVGRSDHFDVLAEEGAGGLDPEALGCVAVDDQIEDSGWLDRQIRWSSTIL
jgi:hypothetical protein